MCGPLDDLHAIVWERKSHCIMEFGVSQSFSLARHGVSLPHVERERERERENLFVFFAIVHVDPPSSIKLVIVVGGENNMICLLSTID